MDIFLGSANAAELFSFFLDVLALLATIIYLGRVILSSMPSLIEDHIGGRWHNSEGKRSLGNQHIGRKRFA